MKKLLAASIYLALGFLPPLAQCQRISSIDLPTGVPQWNGIATRYDPRMLGGAYLHDAQNVWFDEDIGVVKRRGSNQYGAIANSLPVRTLANWIDTSGTEYLFAVSGATIAYTTNGTFTTVLSTFSSSADTSYVGAMDKIWFSNITNGLNYWDGSNLLKSTNAATGRYVTRWRNRLWLSGIGGARARLDGSHHLDGNTWTVGAEDDSPTQIVVGANDGYPVNCLYGGHSDYLLVGKEKGIYVLTGIDKSNFNLVEVADDIGCRSNRTMAAAGPDTFWLSKRGVEKMSQFNIQKVSDPVQDIVDNIVGNSAAEKYWTQSSQEEWEAGSFNPLELSATRSVGAMQSSYTYVVATSSSDFVAGSFSTEITTATNGSLTLGGSFFYITEGQFENGVEHVTPVGWTCTGSFCYASETDFGTGTHGYLNGSSASLSFYVQNTNNDSVVASRSFPLADVWTSTTVAISTNVPVTITFVAGSVTMESTSFTAVSAIKFNYYAYGNTLRIDDVKTDALFSHTNSSASVAWTRTFDTAISTPLWGSFNINGSSSVHTGMTFTVASSTSNTGVFETAVAQTTGVAILANNKRFLRVVATLSTSNSTTTPRIDDLSFTAVSTGMFISQCKNIGTAITAWSNFNAGTELVGSGSISFAISTGTTCHGVTRATATWTAVSAGEVPSVATSAYVAFRTYFGPTSATDTVKLTDHEINWIEGNSTQLPIGCSDTKGRYWLFYTTSTATDARLDSALVYQQNGQWTRHTGVSALSCAQKGNNFYTGSSRDDGKVFIQDTGYSDVGVAIDAFVETQDYDMGCWHCYKSFKRFEHDLKNTGTVGKITTKYQVNGNGSWYNLGDVTLNEDSDYINASLPWSNDDIQNGKIIRFRIGNNEAGEEFRFHRARVVYESDPPEL